MASPLGNRKVLIGLGLVILVAIAAGFVYLRGRGEEGSTVGEEPPKESLLARNSLSFTGAGDYTFDVFPPLGWARTDDEDVDLRIGALSPDIVPSTEDEFTTNILFSVYTHEEISASSIEDYAADWKPYLLGYYPSINFVDDYQTKIGGLSVYVVEMTQPLDGVMMRQMQYILWLDRDYALFVTVTSLDSAWNKHKDGISDSIKSIELDLSDSPSN